MTTTDDLLAAAAAPRMLPGHVRDTALMVLADTLAGGAAESTASGGDDVLTAARGWGTVDAVPIDLSDPLTLLSGTSA